jgi:drug/metabolite transporter (DMT)-like permease
MNPILALVIANIIWGAASPIFKLALTNIPPFTLAFIRFFFAGIIFLPWVLKKWRIISVKDLIEIFLSAFFGITINISFFFLGLQKAPSINAPIIASSAPVFIFLLAVLILKEKPKLRVFWGMFVSLMGILVITFSPILFNGQKLMLGEVEGNLFFILATLGSVLKPVINKSTFKRQDLYLVTFWEFIFGAIMFIPLTVPELRNWSISQLNLYGWLGIIFGVFFSSALAYFLFNWGLARIKAQESGLFAYIDPVVALIIAIPLLGEYPTIHYFIGSLFVFLGIFIAEKRIHWHPIHKLKTQMLNIKN